MFRNWLFALVCLCLASSALGGNYTLNLRKNETNNIVPSDDVTFKARVIPGTTTGTVSYRAYRRLNGGSWFPSTWVVFTNGVPDWPSGIIYVYGDPWSGNTTADFTNNWEFAVTKDGVNPDTATAANKHVWSSAVTHKKNPGIGATLMYPAANNVDQEICNFGPDCPPRDLTFKWTGPVKLRTDSTWELIVNGAVEGAGPIPAEFYGGATPTTLTVGPVHLDHGDFTYQWKIDGSVVGAGSFGCYDEIPGNLVTSIGSYTQPAGSPTPGNQPPPGAPGSTSPPTNPSPYTPSPGQPTAPTAPAANTYTSGGAVSTQGGMYAAVRQALNDAGKDTPDVGVPQRTPESIKDDLERRGKWDELQSSLDDLTGKMESARDGVSGKADDGRDWLESNLPTSIGTVSTYSLGTVTIGGQSKDLVLNFDTFSGPISTLRLAVLFGITVLFVVALMKTIRYYL